ncbi:UDP-glucose--hexose-1-phosphate uridylyltransferase [Gorillibacterium massiliense]|uniref:UDP-glucose--hexose-1-phosphate uridylyltransferase n=1 Tax=Gorillibacterium massiliense TaxID=1280390 RepID=UPI0004B962BF|nr:UDP-glucose--hexose-1-phosphate uridylyltransferase [Gorillibacterium massiliense]
MTEGSTTNTKDIRYEIARLVEFAVHCGMLEELDRIPANNALLDLLQVEEPYAGQAHFELPEGPDSILDGILDYAAEKGLLPDNTTTYRDLMDARIMGLLMPRQSEVASRFAALAAESPELATDAFYKMSIDANYIRMDRIRKNLYWLAPTEYGDLEITVNLSKPEKDPKEIAAERNAPQSSYPKCLLCVENVGYAGRINHPARQNHRIIPLVLDNSQWYFQYSPYVYYNEHSIILSSQHVPMKISRNTFVRLFDFIDQFPHYFIGSNADLPIVGGSILNHDHFQGGRHVFPMEQAPVEAKFTRSANPGVQAGIVKWPMSVIRLAGKDRNELIQLADEILTAWRAYTDADADILAHSSVNGVSVPHNTITPIARINQDGNYEFDLVLRNNRTTEEHPLGIFHPHADLHHIKKENIGLIEVMGLAVLPGRLQQEMKEIATILASNDSAAAAAPEKADHPLHAHATWIGQLANQYGKLTEEAALETVKREIGLKFMRVLMDAGVYKRTESGQQAFRRFLQQVGFSEN